MKRSYQIVDQKHSSSRRQLAPLRAAWKLEPKPGWDNWRSWHSGWSGSIRVLRPVCAKA